MSIAPRPQIAPSATSPPNGLRDQRDVSAGTEDYAAAAQEIAAAAEQLNASTEEISTSASRLAQAAEKLSRATSGFHLAWTTEAPISKPPAGRGS